MGVFCFVYAFESPEEDCLLTCCGISGARDVMVKGQKTEPRTFPVKYALVISSYLRNSLIFCICNPSHSFL